VVVSIHGGYFQKQYRRDIHDPLARRLVASGIAVLNIEYRRARTDGSLDRTTDDVMAAISSLRERESRDRPHRLRERVTALGHSAGGYLALWAGSHPDVEHVVALAAASDLVDCVQGGYDGGSVAAWLGATPKEAPALYAQADLLARLPMGTTSWLVHGDADTTVPPHQSTRYAERARQVGDDAEVHLLPGHGHFGVIDPRDDAFAQWHKLLLERVLP
jgi:acetyl esterase/lipase